MACCLPAPSSLQQMMRLKRELDRVTEERDRARDSGKRAEQARQQLEVELKVRGGKARACSTCPIGAKLHVLAMVLRQPTACCVIAIPSQSDRLASPVFAPA